MAIKNKKNQFIEHKFKDKTFRYEVIDKDDMTQEGLSQLSEKLLSYVDRFFSFHPDFFYLLDRHHRFRYASSSLLSLWGMSFEEAEGKTFEELKYPPELVDLHKAQFEASFSGKIVRGENSYTNENGNWGYYEYIFVPLANESGEIEFVGGITRDITQRKKLERDREKVLYTVTHDIKTPLNVIQGALDLVPETDSKEELNNLLKMMQRNIDRLDHLVNDILKTAAGPSYKVQSFSMKDWDLRVLLNDTFNYLTTAFGDLFELHLPPRKVKVHCDSNSIYRILENLCDNAIKYGDTSRPITVKLSIMDEEAIISVHNYGPEIEKSKLEKIFDYLERATSDDSTSNGWGIGLSTVRKLASAHNGGVKVESSREKGTCFKVCLPLLAEEDEK